jgi:hypothetical protein
LLPSGSNKGRSGAGAARSLRCSVRGRESGSSAPAPGALRYGPVPTYRPSAPACPAYGALGVTKVAPEMMIWQPPPRAHPARAGTRSRSLRVRVRGPGLSDRPFAKEFGVLASSHSAQVALESVPCHSTSQHKINASSHPVAPRKQRESTHSHLLQYASVAGPREKLFEHAGPRLRSAPRRHM